MPIPRDPPLSPESFKALMKAKGWRSVELAGRWGKSVQWVSTLIQDPERGAQWDDAVRGLPRLPKAHQRALAEERAADRRSKRRLVGRSASGAACGLDHPWRSLEEPFLDAQPPRPGAGYRYRGHVVVGDILAATEDLGSLVTEGERAVVVDLTDTGQEERYGLLFETGHFDRFTPDAIDRSLATTGLVDLTSAAYTFEGEARLGIDFLAGRFAFYPE